MAKSKSKRNPVRCRQKIGNGLNSTGPHNSRAGGVDRKNKSKRHGQELLMSAKAYRLRIQEVLHTSEHIFTKIFRKDGPMLGDQFDSLPSNAFPSCKKDPRKSHDEESQQANKKRKISMQTCLNYQTCSENISLTRHGIGKGLVTAKGVPVKKHRMGKGLMTQIGAPGKTHGIGKGLMMARPRTYPGVSDFSDYCTESTTQKKKREKPRESIQRKLANKELAKRKTPLRSRKIKCQKVQKYKRPFKEKCQLALDDVQCLENTDIMILLDDEELELQELQAGSDPLTSCDHFVTNSSHGCSLCKDLLAKFPPNSVIMRRPLSVQPWASSPELVNKLFKVFHFLCTYAVTVCISSFTFDEFVQAFHDKDSVLLGQVHVALLRALLSDVDKELRRGFFSLAIKNCMFLRLLHTIEHRRFVAELWHNSLNLLTWTEILRQILVAAGFSSKLSTTEKSGCDKEANLMDRYGLSSSTLKGELFSILLTQGYGGMEVSDLAKSSSIVELNLTDKAHDLENLITTVLSGDITLFEKISHCGYRLRIHATENDKEDYPSDSESGDGVSGVTGGDDTNDFVCDSRYSSALAIDGCKSDDILTVCDEIDESHPGEAWLLGLMEGEYSDLNVDENLSALVALVDLLHAGSSVRMEDILMSSEESATNIKQSGSGAKIKRSVANYCDSLSHLSTYGGQRSFGLDQNTQEPIDSLVVMSKISEEEKYANIRKIAEQMGAEDCLHCMQSIFLGSDRRYNRYWLFLGTCDESDPGHRRVYFESSEDGHWEMIDTEEALCQLLSVLDRRGAREARLIASLERRISVLSHTMSNTQNNAENRQLAQQAQSDSSSPVSDVDNRSSSIGMQNESPTSTRVEVEKCTKGDRLVETHSRAFDMGIWKSFYYELNSVKNGKKAYLDSLRRCDQCHDLYWKDEKHCRLCHTTFELGFDLEENYAVHCAVCPADVNMNRSRMQRVFIPSQLQALKAAIYAIESAIPADAFLGSWKRSQNLWVNRLRRVSTLSEFLQVLADFVTALDEDWFYENDITGSNGTSDDIISDFSTMPRTCSAVALWLVKLDTSVASRVGRNS